MACTIQGAQSNPADHCESQGSIAEVLPSRLDVGKIAAWPAQIGPSFNSDPLPCASVSTLMSDVPSVWIYVLVGTEHVQKHIMITPEEVSCNIPLCDFEPLPFKQSERMSKFEDKYLILGNGMQSYKYSLICADAAHRTWLFAGPASREDVMVVKLMEKRNVVFRVSAQLEPTEGEPMVRMNAQYMATGEYLKPDGWQFPSIDRVYLRHLEEMVLMEMFAQNLGGPHCDLVFLGRSDLQPLPFNAPLWDPRARVIKPKMRVWGKKTPSECSLLSKVSKH